MRAFLPILLVAAAPVTVHPPVHVHTPPREERCVLAGKAAAVTASPARRVAPLPLLDLARPALVTLAPTRRILLETPTEHAARPASFGGMLELRAPLTGRYRFATDGDVWLDLTSGGKVVPVADEPRAPCKTIEFDLDAGTYTVQLSDSVNRSLTLLATPPR